LEKTQIFRVTPAISIHLLFLTSVDEQALAVAGEHIRNVLPPEITSAASLDGAQEASEATLFRFSFP